MKFAFVILHYKTVEDTLECIESILNNNKANNVEIIVVDNNCPNPRKDILYNNYKQNSNFHILKENKNLGFARGNNKGYKYAKEKLNADFIAIINNDTIINQSDFISLIITKYQKNRFDILGPKIISTKDFKNQNPRNMWHINKINTILMIIYVISLYILNFLGILNLIKYIIEKTVIKECKTQEIMGTMKDQEAWDVALHGSCLIFSPDYVQKFNGLYSNTFLYREEEILFYSIKILKLRSLYYPNVKILHKEDSATNAISSSSRNKRRFQYKHSIKSLLEVFSIVSDNDKLIKNLTEGV